MANPNGRKQANNAMHLSARYAVFINQCPFLALGDCQRYVDFRITIVGPCRSLPRVHIPQRTTEELSRKNTDAKWFWSRDQSTTKPASSGSYQTSGGGQSATRFRNSVSRTLVAICWSLLIGHPHQSSPTSAPPVLRRLPLNWDRAPVPNILRPIFPKQAHG